MSREVRMRKADMRKTDQTHVRIGEFQNALRKENQARSKAHRNNTGGTFVLFEKEWKERVHLHKVFKLLDAPDEPEDTVMIPEAVQERSGGRSLSGNSLLRNLRGSAII